MDHPLIVGPPVALGIFVVLVLMREAAIASGTVGWGCQSPGCIGPASR